MKSLANRSSSRGVRSASPQQTRVLPGQKRWTRAVPFRRRGPGPRGRPSPALQAPLRFPAMAPGARVGAGAGRPPACPIQALDLDYPGRSRRELPALASPPPPRRPLEPSGPALNFPNEQALWHLPLHPGGLFLSIPFPGAGGARTWLTLPGRSPPRPTPAEPGGSPPTPQQQGA